MQFLNLKLRSHCGGIVVQTGPVALGAVLADPATQGKTRKLCRDLEHMIHARQTAAAALLAVEVQLAG